MAKKKLLPEEEEQLLIDKQEEKSWKDFLKRMEEKEAIINEIKTEENATTTPNSHSDEGPQPII